MSTPVNKEVAWDKTKTIMSKTDAKGTIEYVNQVFIDVCGYSEGELIGKPHNVIRHPDMPKTLTSMQLLKIWLSQGSITG